MTNLDQLIFNAYFVGLGAAVGILVGNIPLVAAITCAVALTAALYQQHQLSKAQAEFRSMLMRQAADGNIDPEAKLTLTPDP